MYKNIFLAWFVLAALFPLFGQPEFAALDRAYAAQRVKSYDEAAANFREAIKLSPGRADIRKDLAYLLLKIGQNDEARDQFRQAMELNPSDSSVAMEFAFLVYETREDQSPNKALARRIFDRIRRTGNATAEEAFQNIDKPLSTGIDRWTRALQIGPESFSAHYELAQLAEQRDDLPLAAVHYLRAWQLIPARKGVLLDLARVYAGSNRPQEAMAALIAASRGGEPRAAERARELLPDRYPYVYEFRQAVSLDPANIVLHRELAYLLLAMKDPLAEKEFEAIVKASPDDLLSAAQLGLLYGARNNRAAAIPLFERVLAGKDFGLAARMRPIAEPNSMADRSYQAGFLKDALHYLFIARELDPSDFNVMLKLGWTYNMMHDDKNAVRWFDLARQSPDASISNEAALASKNLKPSLELFRTTAWVLPFYSTRWKDFFGYGQIKAELNIRHKWLHPYVSTRLIADTRPTNGAEPLSERSFIVAAGLSSQWNRFIGWAEAGSAIGYTTGSMRPDYRGGVSWARRWATEREIFVETNDDEVFISRFGNDWLSYSQNRFGYRWFLMNANLTADTSRQHWANFVEAGPGIRFHIPSSPKNLLFSINYLRGKYLVSDGNPQHKMFNDARIGFWYAITNSVLLALAYPLFSLAGNAGYTVLGANPEAWPQMLSSVGLLPSSDGYVTVIRPGTSSPANWRSKVEEGAILILEGDSPTAASFGFRPGAGSVTIASMLDTHAPKLPLILAKSLQIKQFAIPPTAYVFTRDRWSDTPTAAGMKRGKGAVLWIAADPGAQGYEQFPYLLQALTDLGFEPPFSANRTWAFFDYSYRARVDLDYFAAKWRRAGISALHVASWHFYEPDSVRDAYLLHLIEACHREGILVYAWIELPHVSEKFWLDHPEWREKTAVLQDAALDWRKLMNLSNPECFKAASAGIAKMLGRFDWDGANLAELYFESLEGAANPARFTPLNGDVRHRFQREHGFDPIELWSTRKDAASLRTFLDFRAQLARQMQEAWIREIEKCRTVHPDLDIVLTHIDDRMDMGMRDALGADSSRVLPLLHDHNFTFLVEDPATVWNLGPQRYTEIAKQYPASPKIAIDINVVERYQDVYPTKQQTGLELFELIHLASAAFPQVALYFENSLSDTDLPLLPAASAVVTKYEQRGQEFRVDSPRGFLLPWNGAARMDGTLWAAGDGHNLIVPAGEHQIRPATEVGPMLISFNGDLHSARRSGSQVEIAYHSSGRALAKFSCDVTELRIDGELASLHTAGRTLLLPSGERRANVLCR